LCPVRRETGQSVHRYTNDTACRSAPGHGLGFVATLVPAYRATRIDPLKAFGPSERHSVLAPRVGRKSAAGCYGLGVDDEHLVTCPYCGETVEIYVESDVKGSFVQDCEVCCNPWRVRVTGRGENRDVHVTRADGSE
jgi:hypothetical protein